MERRRPDRLPPKRTRGLTWQWIIAVAVVAFILAGTILAVRDYLF